MCRAGLHVNRSPRFGKRNVLDDSVGQRGSALTRRLVLMAKEPRPGRVKTRMCPPLSPELAARCHEAFVTDTLSHLAAAAGGAELELAVAPAGASPRLERLAAISGWRCVDQEGPDLGARMRARLGAGVGKGARTLVLGADTPDLPLARIEEAFLALEARAVVLGPAEDGGYYLIGCRSRVPEVFGPEMPWGQTSLLQQTLARLGAAGVDAAILEPWPDVDDWPALVALARRLRARAQAGDQSGPQSTLRFLAELGRLGMTV